MSLLAIFLITLSLDNSNDGLSIISKDFSSKVYDDQAGLPSNRVEALAFDSKGYLWAATGRGVAYYNGRIWKQVPYPDELYDTYTRSILLASDSSLWFGANGGLARYDEGKWTVFTEPPFNKIVMSLCESRLSNGSSIIWAATRNGLAAYYRSEWNFFNKDNSPLPVNDLSFITETLVDGVRTLWIGSLGGGIIALIGFDAGLDQAQLKWRVFNTQNSAIPENTVDAMCKSVYGGGIWATTYSGIVRLKENGQIRVYTRKEYGVDSSGFSVVETIESGGKWKLWVGLNSGGILSFDGKEWKLYGQGEVNANDQIISLLPTFYSSGELSGFWVATRSVGIIRLRRSTWRMVIGRNESITSILQAQEGGKEVFWYGTWGAGLVKYSDGKWTRYTTADGLPDNIIRALLETEDERGKSLWVGTQNGGIALYRNGQWHLYSTASGHLPGNRIYCFIRSKDGTVWTGTMEGLAFYKGGVWGWFNKNNSGISGSAVLNLCADYDSEGKLTLWVGTDGGGLNSYTEGRWRHYDVKSGLPSNTVLSVMVTVEGGKKYVWAGTTNGLVFQQADLLDQQWRPVVDEQHYLYRRKIFQLGQDNKGRKYAFTDGGVVVLKREGNRFRSTLLNVEDGLPINQPNIGASYIDKSGRIWIGTNKGVAYLDTEQLEQNLDKVASLEIERVDVNQENRRIDGKELSYDENNLEFEYALLNYFHESETRYRTQLVGFESKATGWMKEGKRTYTNLSAGKYTFKVWARDYLGNEVGPVEVSFRIRAAPWLSWWAYLGYGLLSVGTFWLLMKWRLRFVEARNRELEAKVQERTAKLEEAYDKVKRSEMELQRSNAQILDSIRYARNIQRAVLYGEEVFEPFGEYFVLYLPKDEVSGDFYWCEAVGDAVIVAVGDCTGHGVPGALMSMLAVSLLNQIVKVNRVTEPELILTELSRRIEEMLKHDRQVADSMDVAVCNVKGKVLKFAAARRPLYYVEGGKLREFKGDRHRIGSSKRTEYTCHTVLLNGVAAIYLSTDGFADQNDREGKRYKSSRLKQLLCQIHSLEMAKQKEILHRELRIHMQSEVQRDDITIVGLRLNGQSY
ncbi:MAG: SpoIIE family protein phosphatase [Acidobacteriota bacterium]|nr:SpoIIE family protein phosphatase [Blastocatellia bacterium]MDW8412955.1 SpoIIE family protein phosphatase [Acidobacteriota bacterium]